MAKASKLIYFFGGGRAEGRGAMKDLLGGKGAGLAEMTNTGIPVPPGFTITTKVCNAFYEKRGKLPRMLDGEMRRMMCRIEKLVGAGFGDSSNPLLLSVRSGAKFSMPGMMDTILNLGLNDQTVEGLARKTQNERFAFDCYRRFISMFGNVVMGIDKEHFEKLIHERKKARNVKTDLELTATDMKWLVQQFKECYRREQCTATNSAFPQEVWKQLFLARDAVFKSWNNPRAVTYRNLYKIPHDLGTAVNVQAMVFGNSGKDSGTGVGFTRDPSTGENRFYGEFLTNAQGEDVVAGIRTPQPLSALQEQMPETYAQLQKITLRLERHYRDVQDFEFTIQEGTLYMLQTRNAKRTGYAALAIAMDMVREKLIRKEEALLRIEPAHLEQLLHPILDPQKRKTFRLLAKGLNASPGAAAGRVVFNPESAVERASKGERVLLVRRETSPDDIHGMAVAKGVLTATGGMTSHAAVVCRQMGKPSVVGCAVLHVDENRNVLQVADTTVKEGDYLSIDGATGEVLLGDVPTRESEVMQVLQGTLPAESSTLYQNFAMLLEWADKARRLGVRANADIPRDAAIAVKLGAEGIGLCRTEHMFFAEERVPLVQQMILAKTTEERKRALDKLLPLQREDFRGLFETMAGRPVTIRTLDPPLHEFLPKREELMVALAEAKAGEPSPNRAQQEQLLQRVEELHEFNPMMGHRGCRLGIVYPEITEMQAQAIFEAACDVAQQGGAPQGGAPQGKQIFPEIMVPLVGSLAELQNQKAIIDRTAKSVMARRGVEIAYQVGTMIEVPRAALLADEIAREAAFFSFGTNDLTQMTFGFSRDDSGKFLPTYIKEEILPADPFATLDPSGVGGLIQIALERARKTRPKIKTGICGEHGGDPASIHFCHRAGLSYVSCSPYRLPMARLAAAQAALQEKHHR